MKRFLFLIPVFCVVAMTVIFSGAATINNSSFDIEDLHDNGTITIFTDVPSVIIEQHKSVTSGQVRLVGKDWSKFNVSVDNIDGNFTIEVELKDEEQTLQAKRIHSELRVELPADFQNGSLLINTYAGDCKITSNVSCSKMGLSTYSGDIEVVGATANEKISLTTYSGSITGRSLAASAIALSTASGNIKFDRLDVGKEGSFVAKSMSGNVEIKDMVAYHVAIDSISGNVKCNIPKNFNGAVVARTVIGKIQNNYHNLPEANIQTSSDNSNTATDSIHIYTITGAITIKD